MKAEIPDLKKLFGEIRLFPETIDDLWHIKHLVGPGDLVFALTFRSLESASDKLRPEKVEKKPLRLGIRVEKVEFHQHANRLRIYGIIEHGVDIGFHHTLNIEPGYELSIIKTWRAIDLDRIDRSVKASTAGVVHVVTIEEGEAEIFRIRQYGPEPVTSINAGSGKREGLDARSAFFESVLTALQGTTGPLVVAGPGFVKDDFLKFVKGRDADLAGRCMPVETRRVGRGAVQDVIGQGVLDRINEDIQLAREVRLMEEILTRIGTNGPVAYGMDEVEEAIACGAVEHILVIDEIIRDARISTLLEAAEAVRASIVVFSSEFEPGKQLEALGGIAALLRFKIK